MERQFAATSDKSLNFEIGQPKSLDKEYIAEFSSYQPLAGFVGYQLDGITALGFYRYMCNTPPPTPTDPTDPNGGSTTDDETTKDDQKEDPTGEGDKPLDGDGNSRENATDKDGNYQELQIESNSS